MNASIKYKVPNQFCKCTQYGGSSRLSSEIWPTVNYLITTIKFKTSRPWFNIKISSYQYRKSHCWDKTILRPSYLHNGISYTGKMTSLYWIRAQTTFTFFLEVATGTGITTIRGITAPLLFTGCLTNPLVATLSSAIWYHYTRTASIMCQSWNDRLFEFAQSYCVHHTKTQVNMINKKYPHHCSEFSRDNMHKIRVPQPV